MKSNLFSKILGVGVSAGFVASSFLFAVPAAADTTEWSTINTPSWENGVILPASDILDYDISGEDGNTIYVIAEVDRACADESPFLDEIETETDIPFQYALFKSTDGGVSWSDITQNVIDADNLPNFTAEDEADDDVDADDIFSLNYVAAAPDDEDWVAVTGYGNDVTADDLLNTFQPFTVASKDGGSNFAYTSDMEDTSAGLTGTEMDIVFDTEVSPETTDGLHLIAAMGAAIGLAGTDMPGYVVPDFAPDQGTVYLLNAGTWLTGGWEDTSFWDGWDGDEEGNNETATNICGYLDKDINSLAEIDGEFSPNFGDDCALVVIGDAYECDEDIVHPYVQTLDICSEQWGEEASLPEPIEINADGDDLMSMPGIWMEGIALPADYDAEDSGARVVFGYVDAVDMVTMEIGGFVFRLDDTDVSPQVAPSENPLLASIAVSGDADTGKMMIGEYIQLENDDFGETGSILVEAAEECAGVRVWHSEELDICCPLWELCCKCPSGTYAARVVYTPDGSKEYATTTGSNAFHDFNGENSPTDTGEPGAPTGNAGDETAFSVSLDDATSWNQIGLIDTDIDKLSDYVICPDCSVAYLSTLNDGDGANECIVSEDWFSGCDSVWRTFDTGKTWERVNHGNWLEGSNWDGPELLLRLPCEDVENCCDYTDPSAPGGTLYLGIQGDDQIWYSRDCGQCWTKTQDTKIDIQDFAVDTESTVYVLDIDGNVSKSTNFGRRWADSVDTGAGSGHMITVCCGQGMIVVGPGNWEGGDAVAWSDDAGDSWNTTDDIPIDGEVHVACATTCENIIYIAVDPQDDEGSDGAIYRGDLTDGSWTDMNAAPADYTGIAVGRSDGTLYASTDLICYDVSDTNHDGDTTDPCDKIWGECAEEEDGYSAVARNIDPCDTACCGSESWDYLICGLSAGPEEEFDIQVNALDICGCLTSATNTKLWAIDNQTYDVVDGSDGTVWTYEDCASKVGPTLLAPADGTVLDCMACENCSAQPFTLKWDRLCNSCSYDIEIMDEDGNVINSLVDVELTGTGSCSFVFNPQNSEFSGFFSELVCGSTYKWHVREANTTCECIHSQWSATWTFTVATSSSNGVKLIAPDMAATNTGTTNIGFSWSAVPGATSYSFVLSPNANLSGALVSREIGTTAFNYAGPLENGKTYYWQVKAWKGTTLLSTSPIGVFTVGPKPVEPQPPVVVQQTPAPQINIPPAQQITPTWIYAIIGIGAALAVVVIVLIVRTRRP